MACVHVGREVRTLSHGRRLSLRRSSHFSRGLLVSHCRYGEAGPKATLPAYDLLVQAESGLCTVSGISGEPARVGVSLVDISTGLNAHSAIVEALFARERTGKGRALKTSLFASASELMSVPYLQHKVRLLNLMSSNALLHHAACIFFSRGLWKEAWYDQPCAIRICFNVRVFGVLTPTCALVCSCNSTRATLQ